jgi:hypothetical protein
MWSMLTKEVTLVHECRSLESPNSVRSTPDTEERKLGRSPRWSSTINSVESLDLNSVVQSSLSESSLEV